MSKESISTKSNIIRTETENGKNTGARVAAVIDDINETKIDEQDVAALYVNKGEFTQKISEVESSVISGIKGEAIPSTIPTPWNSGQPYLYEKYDINVEGTFVNFKDSENNPITISPDELKDNFVQLWVENGVSKKVLKSLPNDFKLDESGGALSFEVGIGLEPLVQGPKFEKITPVLTATYYTYNTSTGLATETPYASFRTATLNILAGESIRADIGSFYVQNSNPLPLLIHVKNSANEIIYFSNGASETGATPGAGNGVSVPVDFTWTFDEDCTVFISCDYVTGNGKFDLYKKGAGSSEVTVLNTSKADKPGGYVSFDNFSPGVGSNPYKNKMLRVAGDSISEPGGVNAPTTSKYWYEYLAEDLEMSYKTYAYSGNQWTDVYNQLVQMKADETSTGKKTNVLIIFAGTNDYYFNTPIGEAYTLSNGSRVINLNDASFKGRVNKALNYARRNFPTAQILVCNILHRGPFQGSGSELTPNGAGIFLDEYSKAIDEATQLWSMPLIDIRGESQLYPVTEMSSFYTMGGNQDMLHPNNRGHFRIKGLAKARLLSLPTEINLP